MTIKEEDHLLDGQVDQIDNEIDNSGDGENTYENVMSDNIDGVDVKELCDIALSLNLITLADYNNLKM